MEKHKVMLDTSAYSAFLRGMMCHFGVKSLPSTNDEVVKSPKFCHCDKRSVAAISIYQADTNDEIASLRSQRRLSRLLTKPSTNRQQYGFLSTLCLH